MLFIAVYWNTESGTLIRILYLRFDFDLNYLSRHFLCRKRKLVVEKKMASSADVRDIMGMDGGSNAAGINQGEITKEMILGSFDKPKKNYSKKPEAPKRPEGMARELYNLLYSDSKDAPSLIPTDTSMGKGEGYLIVNAHPLPLPG